MTEGRKEGEMDDGRFWEEEQGGGAYEGGGCSREL